MKKFLTPLTLIAFALVILTSCKRIDKLTQFTLEYDSSVVIPSSTGMNLPFDVMTPDIESKSESKFAVNDTRKDLIEEINLTEMKLELTSPVTSDFSFLKSITIAISANGLNEIDVAWYHDIPDNVGKSLQLTTSNADLQEYIKKDEFSLHVTTVTDELLASDHEIAIHAEFFVDAKVLGQ